MSLPWPHNLLALAAKAVEDAERNVRMVFSAAES